MKSVLNFFNSKNSNYILIGVVFVMGFFLFKGCQGNKNTGVSLESFTCDTVYNTIVNTDTFWKIAAIPEPEIKIVEVIKKVFVNDTVFMTNVINPEPKLIYVSRQDSLFVYDSTYVDANYKLLWHIESLGTVRNFAHRLEFVKQEATSVRTTNLVTNEADERKWLLMFEGLAQSDFKGTFEPVIFAGGSLNRTWKRFGAGVGYLNQIGGNAHIAKIQFGIRF